MKDSLYKLMNWPRIEGVIYAEESHPQEILGPHEISSAKTLVQAFFPGAKSVKIKMTRTKTKKEYDMELADDEGFFAAIIPHAVSAPYEYLVTYENGVKQMGEPYRFPSQITQEDIKRFHAGIHYEIYEVLGAHIREIDGVRGTYFAVWAPNAARVSVVGDFNQWDGRVHPMMKQDAAGIFELFIPMDLEDQNYKFEIRAKGGLVYLKADPYAFGMQLRPDNASVVRDLSGFEWTDQEWMEQRAALDFEKCPINILEIHLGSFAKDKDNGFLSYRQLAKKVIDYAKKMHYSHVELMPVMEHPLDASWGYQTIGYYAPTARFGEPKEFMYFMNACHEAGLGVILDWVPAHFPRDTYGLSGFDGTCLYEHEDPRRGAHPDWGTLIYNYGRNEVSNYLIANGLFWLEKYHADGIRMDAVASMLYLDYGRRDGEWLPNMYGGHENLEAIEFLRHFNSIVEKRQDGSIVIAEESTAWPQITGAPKNGGLGFQFKWNMGWMNDFLRYMSFDPYFRAHHHDELTFSMIYQYSEKFMLVLSHDEVVHGKASMIGKMPGERKDKFANLRAAYGYMMVHPGKKLLFMGQDIAEFDEWNENRSVEWELLQHEEHKQINTMVKDLNAFYHKHPALYENDHDPYGFSWVNNIDANRCMLVFMRKGETSRERLLVIVNFANAAYEKVDIGVPIYGKYVELFNTDNPKYGGSGMVNSVGITAQERVTNAQEYTLTVDVAPLSVSIFDIESLPLPKRQPVDLKKIMMKKPKEDR